MLGGALLDLLDGGDAAALVAEIPAALSLTPPRALERATALYVWKRTWESDHVASRHGGDRKSARYREQDQDEKISFCSMAARAINVGERSVQLDIALAEQLGAADIRRLWDSPIFDNAAALRTVAALDATARSSLFAIWREQPQAGFAAAMKLARLRQDEDSEEQAFARLLDGWTRASSKARRRFLAEIGCDDRAAEALVSSWRKRGAS